MSTQVIDGAAVEIDGEPAHEAVIMVHGLGGTSNCFTPQMAVLGDRYRVVRPDLPGSGRSPCDGALSIQVLADFIAGVAGNLGIARAHLVGHSLGTIVCQHVAVQHPELVRSMTLFGPLIAPPEAARQGLRDRAATVRREGMAAVADAIVQAATSADTKRHQPVTVALVRELLMRQDAEGYARTCEALANATPAEAARIGCPVLLLTGDEDAVAPPSTARQLDERLAGSTLDILSRCGHWTTLERAEDCNARLRDFLARR